MSRSFLFFTSLLIIALVRPAILAAQPALKCGAELRMSHVVGNMSKRGNYVATFDVIRETPTNIIITTFDGTEPYGMFIEETVENLSRLAYPRDTFGVRLFFEYRVDSSVTRGYTQFRGADTIRIVIPGIIPVMRPCHTEIRNLDLEKGTLTLEGNIFTYDSVSLPSSIVVERIFAKEIGNTMIVANNYPALESQIREAAALYDLERFRGSLGTFDEAAFARLRYMIRFRVVRLHRDSRGYEVL